MRTPLAQQDLVFLDTETTGLDPTKHEVIEVAIIRCNPQTITPWWEWSTKIKPERIETAHPKALAVNGYSEEAWADAPTFKQVAGEIADRLRDGLAVGHNVSFDLAFLQAGFDRARWKVRLPYHKIDTVTLAYTHLVPKGLKRLRLDAIRKFYGMSTTGAHTAIVDVQHTREAYIRMVCPHNLIPTVNEEQESILELLRGVEI